jgi:hypothetical protein
MSTLSTGFKPEPSQTATIGLLTLGGALAASWVGINLAFPGLAPTGIPSAVLRLGIHLAILTGLWLGLARTEFSANQRIIIWLGVAIPFTLWLAAVWTLAINDFFQPAVTGFPKLPIAIFAPVIIGLFVLLRSKSIAALLDATPASWLIALQVYRIFGGIFIVNWVKRGDRVEYLRSVGFRGSHHHGHAQHTRPVADLGSGHPGLAGNLPDRAGSRVRRPEFDPAARSFNPAAQADRATAGQLIPRGRHLRSRSRPRAGIPDSSRRRARSPRPPLPVRSR